MKGYTHSNHYQAPYKWQARLTTGLRGPITPYWGKPYWARPYTGWSAYRPWLYYGPFSSSQRSRYRFGTLPPGFRWRGYSPWYGPAVSYPGFYRSPIIGALPPVNVGAPIYLPLEPQVSYESPSIPPQQVIIPEIPLPAEEIPPCDCEQPATEFLFGQPELRRIYSPADRRW